MASLIVKSIVLFVLAGLAEIGGGYLMWLWLREGRGVVLGAIGAVVLVGYGVIPTLQDANVFGRIYAAYGGIFVVMSVFWGWRIDGKTPDRWDLLGAAICLVGVAVMMWAPRASIAAAR